MSTGWSPGVDLNGHSVLLTGGTHGIGQATSRHLAELGARLTVIARNSDDVQQVCEGLPGDGHAGVALDVADPNAWEAARSRLDAAGPFNGVVCAAGILGPIGTLDEVDLGEFASTIGVNLLGTVQALRYALPSLRSAGGSCVTFSGGGATEPLARYDAYAVSKVAVVRLTENVAVSEPNLRINCVAPGFVATRMHDGTLAAGPRAAGRAYHEKTRAQLASGGFPASEAASLVALLLSPESAGISGRLISAQWDPWRSPEFRQRLRENPPLGTLRRIDDQFFSAVASNVDLLKS
jgi:NAD(P)-dependent dehydrogenase (short-subunit alcohol dehydrogenase family)